MSRTNLIADWSQRPTSAQGNLQSHPCFQSSLLDDGHAPGTVDEWRKSLTGHRPQLTMANINRNAKDYDQNLEVKSYFQSVGVRRNIDQSKLVQISSTNIYGD
jgi:hypothetical protein